MSEVNSTVEYRDVPGFPGYRAGSDGTIWSRWKKVGLGWGNGTTSAIRGEWVKLKCTIGKNGYKYVSLKQGSNKCYFLVHQLILITFVGSCPEGMESRHFPDRNPLNNRLDNLRYGTPKDNMADQVVHGTRVRGETHPTSKLSDNQVRYVRSVAAGNPPWGFRKKLARELNVVASVITSVLNGTRYGHVN